MTFKVNTFFSSLMDSLLRGSYLQIFFIYEYKTSLCYIIKMKYTLQRKLVSLKAKYYGLDDIHITRVFVVLHAAYFSRS